MIIYTKRLDKADLADDDLASIKQQIEHQQTQKQYLYLDFDTRQRSRFKAVSENGETVGVDLPRTDTLKDGCVLSNEEGKLIEIKAAEQHLIAVSAEDNFTLMKGAYHLGNRHVPLMITPDTLYFEPDHVLESMLQNLGLSTKAVQAPFEPETGAYKNAHGAGHAHSHSHASHSHASHSHASHSHNDSHAHSDHTHD